MWRKLICPNRSHVATLSMTSSGAQAANVVLPIKLEDQINWPSKEIKEKYRKREMIFLFCGRRVENHVG